MSSEAAEENNTDKDVVCANCGIAEVDEIKLEDCNNGCDLVKYCSDKCREEHREHHHEECKKRADELHARRLFTQPDGSHRGECPICFLPNPIGAAKTTFMGCCGQTTCNGCIYAHRLSNIHDEAKANTCVFCRTPTSDKEEYEKRTKERIEANDPAALSFRGTKCYEAGDYDNALTYLTKATDSGGADAEAHYYLGCMYMAGKCVEKDEEKAIYHWEKAAIAGHPYSRHHLAYIEGKNGSMGKAVKHWIIAAKLGYDKSMKALLPSYKGGYITKEEYGATLRAHQATISATKSSSREAAEKFVQPFLRG